MRKKIFIGTMILIVFGFGIGAYFLTHNAKTAVKRREYIVISGSGTFYKGPIAMHKGATFEDAIRRLNLQRTKSIKEIYVGVGKKKIYHKMSEKLFQDTTIHIK